MAEAKIYISGVIGEDTTLLDVVRQYKSYARPSTVEVHIDSVGGSVDQGKAIFNYLRQLDAEVTTYAVRAYSIASMIFMAGKNRIVEDGADRVMIHFPWAQMAGRSEDFDRMADELRKIEAEFIEFYSAYLKTDKATIAKMLENEEMLSGDDAFTLGFATQLEIPLKAVAFLPESLNQNKKKTIMTKAENLMKALQSFLTGDSKEEGTPEPQSLILQDANGVEINFPELSAEESPEVGAKAVVDGSPANGEFVSPDGSVWVFAEGNLSEIREPEVTEEEAEAEASEEAPEVEEEMNAEEQALEQKIAEEQATIEQMLADLFGRAKAEALEELSAKFEELNKVNADLEAEVKALKKLMGSKDIEEEEQPKARKTNIFA